MVRRGLSVAVAVAVGAVALGAAGCVNGDSSDSAEGEARRAAQAYVDALSAGDAEVACEQERVANARCVEATEEELRTGRPLGEGFGRATEVCLDGSAGRVLFEDGGFLAVSEGPEGWKVGAPAEEAVACAFESDGAPG